MNGQFDIGDFSPERFFIGISAILGLLFAFISESSAHPVAHFLQWQLQTVGAVLVVLSLHLLLFSNAEWLATKPWWRVAISGVLGGLAFSPIALLSDMYLAGDTSGGNLGAAVVEEMVAIVPPITIAWLALNAPWIMGYSLKRRAEVGLKSTPSSSIGTIQSRQEPDFLSQTKLSSAQDILYIKSELHYLNLVTLDNKQLILHSLKEAISQLHSVGINGVQCHRGYWVADAAISTAKRKGRQAVLKLSNEEEIPVSRANVDACLTRYTQ